MNVEDAIIKITELLEKQSKQTGKLINLSKSLLDEIANLTKRVNKLEGKNGKRKMSSKKI